MGINSMKYVCKVCNQSHAKYIRVYFHNAFGIGAKHANGALYRATNKI